MERQSLGKEVTVGGSPAWCVCVCVFAYFVSWYAFINIQHEIMCVMCISICGVHYTVKNIAWQTSWGFYKLFFQQKFQYVWYMGRLYMIRLAPYLGHGGEENFRTCE